MSDLSAIHRAVEDLASKAQASANENREAIASLSQDFTKMQAKLMKMGQEAASGFSATPADTGAGSLIVKSDAFKDFVERNSSSGRIRIDVPTSSLIFKNTITGDGPNDRVLSPAYRRLPVIASTGARRQWLRSQILAIPVSTSNVEYTRETSFVSRAGTQVSGESSSEPVFEGALKGETDATYELKTTPIRTIAHWIKMSKQLLDDAPNFSAYLELRMRYALEIEVERQIVAGNGVTELEGMLTSGNYTPLSGAQSDDTAIDRVHRGLTQLENADYTATALVMSPTGWEQIALLKDAEERYLHGMPASGGPKTLWGLPVFTTPAMVDNSFIAADMETAASIYDRQTAVVEMGYTNDDFTRNLLTVRAELRLALAIYQPGAIVVGQLF